MGLIFCSSNALVFTLSAPPSSMSRRRLHWNFWTDWQRWDHILVLFPIVINLKYLCLCIGLQRLLRSIDRRINSQEFYLALRIA